MVKGDESDGAWIEEATAAGESYGSSVWMVEQRQENFEEKVSAA